MMETPTGKPILEPDEHRSKILTEIHRNRRLAHEVIFKHRHPIATPPFHYLIQDAFHGDHPQVVIEGFRDAAKSTVGEEAIVLKALFGEFKNGVVIGPSHPRAKERLGAIKNEFVVNDKINQLFGRMEGDTWGESKIVLANGVCIQALGQGMSMRGMRYLEHRPDFALIDDLEDEESVRTPEGREKMLHWLFRTFIPALAKGEANQTAYKIRFIGNRLDSDAVIVKIAKDPSWKHYRFPILEPATSEDGGVERYDLPSGHWRSRWAQKFSIDDIARKRSEYERQGLLHDWNCEYMCEADDPAAKLFKDGDAKVIGRIRTYEAVYAAYDPARTTNATSAMTGVAVFSWINNRLIVWRGDAKLWLPDQIIDDIFQVADTWSPVEIGVEATGLEEFIMQPLRHRTLQRRQLLPLCSLKPPRGKDSFIRGLQPFFKSGEVEFVDVSSEARGQLMSFPTGRKDFPNALAYAQMMRVGLAVYDFGRDNAVVQTIRMPGQRWRLVINATNQYTCGILIQVIDGQLRVHADWVQEGPPGEVLHDIVVQARLEAGIGGASLRLAVPADSGNMDGGVGLRAAARTIHRDIRSGGSILRGRDTIRDLLGRRRREQPMLVVSYDARWVLNAFTGGFARKLDKKGQLASEPVENCYRVLMEGLESFAAALQTVDETEQPARMAIGADGRPYKTILATGEVPRPTKDNWDQDVVTSGHSILRRG